MFREARTSPATHYKMLWYRSAFEFVYLLFAWRCRASSGNGFCDSIHRFYCIKRDWEQFFFRRALVLKHRLDASSFAHIRKVVLLSACIACFSKCWAFLSALHDACHSGCSSFHILWEKNWSGTVLAFALSLWCRLLHMMAQHQVMVWQLICIYLSVVRSWPWTLGISPGTSSMKALVPGAALCM